MCRAQKSKLILKIKYIMLLEQLYYMYYNTTPKSAPKRSIVMCFHPRALDKKEGDVDQKLDETTISMTQL